MFKSLLLRHAVIARRNDEAIQREGEDELRNAQKPMTQIFSLRIHLLNQCNLLRLRPRLDLDVVAFSDDDHGPDSDPQVF